MEQTASLTRTIRQLAANEALPVRVFVLFRTAKADVVSAIEVERIEVLKMTSKPDYSEIVKQAEGAVASIKDSDLKTIAFGKILDTLLGEGSTPKEQERESSHKRAAKRKRTNGRR